MKRLVPLVILLLALASCNPASTPGAEPRIVSFAPALTTICFDLGLGDHIVGVDKHSNPPEGQSRPVVGDAMKVNVEPILSVKPDVLLINMAPSHFEAVQQADPDLRIEHFELKTLDDIADAMERIAAIAGKPNVGKEAARSFQRQLDAIAAATVDLPKRRVMYVIGFQQPFGAGRGEFISEMIGIAGGVNVLRDSFEGWKTVSLELLPSLQPDIIICQVEADKSDAARQYWQSAPGVPDGTRIVIVNDPRWTQQSAHLADLTATLAEIIHPNLAKASADAKP